MVLPPANLPDTSGRDCPAGRAVPLKSRWEAETKSQGKEPQRFSATHGTFFHKGFCVPTGNDWA